MTDFEKFVRKNTFLTVKLNTAYVHDIESVEDYGESFVFYFDLRHLFDWEDEPIAMECLLCKETFSIDYSSTFMENFYEHMQDEFKKK